MNVGIFADCYRPTPSGVVTSIVQLKEGLEQRGHKAIIVTVHTPHYTESSTSVYRFPSIPFNSGSGFRLGLVGQKATNRIVEQEQLEVIHTHTEFGIGWAARCAARRSGLPLIHTAHTMYKEYRHYLPLGHLLSSRMIESWWRRFLSPYDALVCPSAKAQNYLQSVVPHIRTVVIGNGLCRARFQPSRPTEEELGQIRRALGIRPSDRVILYVGRIGREKRVTELLYALAPLLHEHPQYKAVWVGCGPSYKQMIGAAKEAGLGNQVIFTGAVAWSEIHKLYSVAHAFTTASLSEVHPMTLIEASTCGLPIVARRDDAYVDLVKEGYNGYLVDADREIATRLEEILGNEALQQRLSRDALLLSGRFDLGIHVEKLESLYEQVVKHTPG